MSLVRSPSGWPHPAALDGRARACIMIPHCQWRARLGGRSEVPVIERYATPEAMAVWSAQSRYAIMLEVEILACEAMEARGDVPKGTAAHCRTLATEKLLPDRFPIARIDELEKLRKHDVIAFLEGVVEVLGEPARFLHKGMTSSDVLDTTFAVQLGRAGDLVMDELHRLLSVLERVARAHAHTLCIGRTHGIHAEPTTFGLKLALHWDALNRGRVRLARAIDEVRVGKISGAVGTFAHLDPSVERYICEKLGLRPAAVSSQIVPRDVHAHFFHAMALVATTVEGIAVEIRHLQRTELREAEEPFTKGQKGSSAMPHKRNPILSENLTGLARLMRGYADMAMDNVVLWHERDISHSSVERVIGPDASVTLHFQLRRARVLIDGLVVDPARMLQNLQLTGGVFYAQRVMLALVDGGLTREDAYARVQRNALQAFDEGVPLLDRLRQDPEITSLLSFQDLEPLFDPGWYVRRTDEIMRRVFQHPELTPG